VLARLDNAQALEGAVRQAEANLAVRQATLMQTRAAIVSSRAEAQASLDQARASAAEAIAILERTEALMQKGVAATATLETAQSRATEAAQTVVRAKATLARFAALAIDDQPDVVVAARNVTAAEAELYRARLDQGRAEVRAPIAGTVLDIHATPGQRPPNEGIMEMGETNQMMAEVEIWQDRIAHVALGQPVEIVAGALGRALSGTVESIGLTVGRQGLISDDAAANSDARVIRVLVALDHASSKVAARYTNLEVVARIDTGSSARVSQ
jgi:HlyD family secretion protein